ncbi:MAG: hypothetical protein AB1499_06645 [Nitrospirota bacterium]
MKKRIIHFFALTLLISAFLGYPGAGSAETQESYKKVDIDINKEDRDVGLKRLELIDKVLTQDMMNRKRSMVHDIESDYDEKTKKMIDSIIAPIFENKVFTHIDVNFFSPDFESEVKASQKVSVSIILKRDGFNTWAAQNPTEQEALTAMKQLIGNTFRIPAENISILIVN